LVSWVQVTPNISSREDLLVSAFLRGWWVVAGFLSSGKWAVIFSIAMGGHGIILVLSRVATLNTFLGSVAGWLSHWEGWEEIGISLFLVLRNSWQC
jgi:hypothetical protein